MKKRTRNYIRWSDKEVKEWAIIYIDTCKPLNTLEQELSVSHSTLYWCFMHRLPNIDRDLFEKVLEMIEIHRRIRL